VDRRQVHLLVPGYAELQGPVHAQGDSRPEQPRLTTNPPFPSNCLATILAPLLREPRQLNRGEALNDLRRFIFFANRGTVRNSDHEDQTTQAHCHTLVVKCLHPLHHRVPPRRDRRSMSRRAPVSDEAIAHLSPGQFETINPYGTLTFDIAGVLERPRRSPRPPNARYGR
jgi:hypothetical protein